MDLHRPTRVLATVTAKMSPDEKVPVCSPVL